MAGILPQGTFQLNIVTVSIHVITPKIAVHLTDGSVSIPEVGYGENPGPLIFPVWEKHYQDATFDTHTCLFSTFDILYYIYHLS